ncbi:aminoglycoside phosphotransferase family protein [Actinoplanes sp. NPDC049596]|uniref:aminoglycoside phosphotransferase family protein n=1 Tax=unclassified Actinoplanes TaxID=2626549 RepID=UPI00343E4B2E
MTGPRWGGAVVERLTGPRWGGGLDTLLGVLGAGEAVAAAFGLGRATGPLVPLSYRSSRTWTLSTRDGRVLVKQGATEEWREDFARAMRFEEKALAAGIAMGRPVRPPGAAFGYAVEVEGVGLVRAYEWIDGRSLDDTDDVSEWLGTTLARLHRIEPLAPERGPAGEGAPEWYRLDDAEGWAGWLREGERLGKPWAPALREGMAGVVDAASWVRRVFEQAGDHVVTHRDVEPWNVLMTGKGPVLIDWDVAGPDSARLEAAQATFSFSTRAGMPEAAVVRRTVDAYADGGGARFAGEDVLVRRVGLRLGRLAERLRMSLGLEPLGPHDRATIETQAVERITDLPAFVEGIKLFARLL